MSAMPTIPYDYARAQHVAFVRDEGAYAEIAITRDTAVEAIAEVRRLLGKPVRTQRLETDAFAQALARAYATGANTKNSAQNAQSVPTPQIAASAEDDLLATRADDGPAAQWVNGLFVAALNAGASDIHLEPFERNASARVRIDGELRDAPVPMESLATIYAAVVARLKVLAQLDLAERRLPQDGRLTVQLAGRAVDVRMSTLPCAFGERVVLRLLDKSAARLDLHALGFAEGTLAHFRRMLAAPHGIVLVTGPTGSGKTTTLYAALTEIAKRTRNVMTVEDPIEYSLPGIAQTAVNPGIGLTFARALRSMLRQDPDVILVGEIRDAETAQIAVQASLTGHLVLATLHTNDAASAVTRLMDMGIEPYLLASSLRGVLAQRLVRRLCTHCRERVSPNAEAQRQLRGLGLPLEKLYEPHGCVRCAQSGYAGRTGVYEALIIDSSLREHIHSGVDHGTIRDSALAQGMVSLGRDGARWLADGTTSLDEVLRIHTDIA
jgi:general secretion pathway protein E